MFFATRYADYKRSGIKFANSRARDSKPIQLVKVKDLKTIQTIIDKICYNNCRQKKVKS